jgi:DNA modification methylase
METNTEKIKNLPEFKTMLDKIHNIDCVEGMKLLPDGCVDLVVTSCPYNVGIAYDVHKDNEPMEEYFEWSKTWLSEVYRTLKDDGRIALNIPYEVNVRERGGRVFIASEFWQIMKEIGFGFFGIVDLEEDSPHRSKTTAWGCYDKDTRVMTNNGLKLFKDVDIKNDLFLTINKSNGHVEYQMAFDYIKKPFNGKLINIKHKGIDLSITDNHNMVLLDNEKIKIQEFNDIKSNSFAIPRTHNGMVTTEPIDTIEIPLVDYGLRTKKQYINNDSIFIKMDNWLKFLGIFLSDGSFTFDEQRGQYKVSIYQTKKRYIKDIEELLTNLPFDFKFKKSKNEYYTCSKQLTSFLIETKSKNLRKIPDYVFNCSVEQKNLFLKWLFYGDGSFHKNGDMWKITVCSKIMTEQIIRLIYETGKICSIYEYDGKEREWNGRLMKSNYKLTTIQILKKQNTYIKQNHISKVDYNDNVYCVSVPNKTLLVEKSGQLVWCGNSWMSSSSPYIYNPKECIILAYKKEYKKTSKGLPFWDYSTTQVEDEEGKVKNKRIYEDKDKNEFMELVFGQWKYFNDTKSLTKATYSLDIPIKAIKILSFKNDIIMDPFSGSGTTFLANEVLGNKNNFIGFELSENYTDIASKRIRDYRDEKKQLKLFTEQGS